MDKDRWHEIEQIVDQALSIDNVKERTTFLSNLLGEDEDLRREVTSLLDSIEASKGLWEDLLASNEILVSDMTHNEQFGYSQDSSPLPDQIGAFRITELLGTGGMGAVYKAERADDRFSQEVAIKILQKEIQSDETLRRFRMEQEILASLKHPNIAQLFDGGVTEDGISYLVMEFVDGVPIDQYCNELKLSIDQRLSLFTDVCKAIQFAHSNLVIHRDLKVQNIYVTSEGVVKVLDFGIAKLLDPKLTKQTLLETRPGQKIWTPQYAAPEQVKGLPVTTATDVYALGVLLYKLLTDRYPLNLEGKELAEIIQIIENEHPVKPSISISSANIPVEIGKRLKISSQELVRNLTGDLDALVLKALRKEPVYRYNTVGQLIEDLERFNKGLPLMARKDTLSYRIGKFYRRNKVGILIVSVIFLLIIGFSFFYTYKISQERNEALYQADRAEKVSDFLVNIFNSNHPDISAGQELSASNLLEMGLESADTLSQPEIKADILDAIGRAYIGLGKLKEAIPILEEVYKISSEYHGLKNAKPGHIMITLGNLYNRIGEYEKANEFTQNALNHYQKIAGDNRYFISRAFNNLADINFFKGDHETAVAFHQQAYEIQIQIFDSTHSNIAATLNAMNASLYQQGKFEESNKIIDRVIAIYKHNFGDEHPRTVEQYSNQALINFNIGNIEKAEEQSRSTLALKQGIYNDMHPSLAAEYNNLGKIITQRNKLEEADSLLRIAIDMRKQIYGPVHIYLARSIHNLAKVLEKQGNSSEALTTFEEGLTMMREAVPPTHPMITNHTSDFGDFLIQQGNIDEALTLLINREREIGTDALNDRELGLLKQKIGTCYLILENYEEAESYLLGSLQILEEKGLNHKRDLEKALIPLIDLYKSMDKPAEAIKYEKLLSANY